jgi:hypothetical protein
VILLASSRRRRSAATIAFHTGYNRSSQGESSTGYWSSGSSGPLYCNFGGSLIQLRVVTRDMQREREREREKGSSRLVIAARRRDDQSALLISDVLSMIMVPALSLMKQS